MSAFPAFLLILLQFSVQVLSKKGGSSGYITTYACEGKTLHINCISGVIRLIRANYGRFSISICNDHGNLDWRVNCMSYQSFIIMQQKCGLKPNCSVNVSSNTFPDPCPKTLKYLEAQYHCITERPSLTTFSKELPSTAPGTFDMAATEGFNDTTEISPNFVPTLPSTLPIITRHSSTTALPTTSSFYANESEPSFTIQSVLASTNVYTTPHYSNDTYCAPTFSRGINWTWTKAGDTAVSACPKGANGVVKWLCKENPVHWSPDEPDLQHCQSLWLENVKSRLENGDSIISISTELAQMSFTKPLFSQDLRIIGELFQQALYKSLNNMENFLDMWHRYHVLRELLQSYVQTLSNLLDHKQNIAWIDMPLIEKKLVVSSLLEGLEESALLLLETSSDDGSFTLVRKNVLLSLQVLKSKPSMTINFPVHSDIFTGVEENHWLHMQDSLLLPSQAIQEHSKNGLFKVVFTAFNNLNDYLHPRMEILQSASNYISSNVTRVVNSRLIGACLERSGSLKLAQPVFIILKHLIEENVTNPVCVYWDFHSSDWSAQGCWVESTNRSHTVCACNHVTNFAVIMDITNVVSVNFQVLHCVISVGCIFAIICLLAAVIIMFTLNGNSTEGSAFIHKNMFLCLLLSEVTFVSGIKQTNFYLTCAIVAGLMQYLFLATFSWMFFECYHQYAVLVRACDMKKAQGRWYYAVAYIVPGVITLVSILVDPSSYGTEKYCWLQADNYFVFSFVGPAISIIFGGLVFTFISMSIFCHEQSIVSVVKGRDDVNLATLKWWNQRSLIIMTLLGSTWASALLYINEESVALAYVFSTLNSLQGAAILALYCFQNKESHRLWCLKKDTSSMPTLTPAAPGPITSIDQKKIENNVNKQGTQWNCSYYPREYGTENQSMFPSGCDTSDRQLSQHRHYLVESSSNNGQSLEHIYEVIDSESIGEDTAFCHPFSPVKNCPEDHSDFLQHSSPSYGNDQRPLLILGNINDPPNFRSLSKDNRHSNRKQHFKKENNEKFCSIGRIFSEDGKVLPSSSETILYKPHSNTQPIRGKQMDNVSLPDLLKCPNENSVVLAVLDGDQVINKVQLSDDLMQPQCNFSRNCKNGL